MRGCNEAPGHSNSPAHLNPTIPFQDNLEKETMGHQHDSCCCFKQKVYLLHQRIKEISQLISSWRESNAIRSSYLLTTLFQFLARGYLLPSFFLFIVCHLLLLLAYTREKSGLALSFSAVLEGKGSPTSLSSRFCCFPSHLRVLPSSHVDSYERQCRRKEFLVHAHCTYIEVRKLEHSKSPWGMDRNTYCLLL